MASQETLSSISVGDLVAVSGSPVASGLLYADDVIVSSKSYVPGATEVFVSGILASIDLTKGTARMGDLVIDYTASLGSADAPAGALWSFKGIQPTASGRMLSGLTHEK